MQQSSSHRRSNSPPRRRQFDSPPQTREVIKVPPLKDGDIRVLCFSGASELGRNMYGIEYKDSIIIIDCGILFAESTTPGIDFLLPNTQYLQQNRHKVKAMIITQGSLSYLGALPFIHSGIGSPPVYARPVTKKIIEFRQKLFRKRPLNVVEIEKEESHKINDDFTLQFFGIADSAPTTFGTLIETPKGCIAVPGNMQLTHDTKNVDEKIENERFKIFEDKKVLLSLADSINVEKAGCSIAEDKIVANAIEDIQECGKRRVILPLFPSQIYRNAKIVEHLIKEGRKVYVQSIILLAHLDFACDVGILKVPRESLIPIGELKDNDQDNVAILTVGAENEEFAALHTISESTHRFVTINEDDAVIFPFPMIQANAREVQDLKDRLSVLGATITTYDTNDVRSSGHAGRTELKWMHQKMQPTFFIPIQGYHYMLTAHANLLKEIGYDKSSIVIPDNGSVIDIDAERKTIRHLKQKVPSIPAAMDGSSSGAIQEIVLRDRKTLSQEGIFILIILLDKAGKIKKSPDIISRGFIYLHQSQDLIARARIVIKQSVEKYFEKEDELSNEKIKKVISKDMQSFLLAETNKKPIVIPVIFKA